MTGFLSFFFYFFKHSIIEFLYDFINRFIFTNNHQKYRHGSRHQGPKPYDHQVWHFHRRRHTSKDRNWNHQQRKERRYRIVLLTLVLIRKYRQHPRSVPSTWNQVSWMSFFSINKIRTSGMTRAWVWNPCPRPCCLRQWWLWILRLLGRTWVYSGISLVPFE